MAPACWAACARAGAGPPPRAGRRTLGRRYPRTSRRRAARLLLDAGTVLPGWRLVPGLVLGRRSWPRAATRLRAPPAALDRRARRGGPVPPRAQPAGGGGGPSLRVAWRQVERRRGPASAVAASARRRRCRRPFLSHARPPPTARCPAERRRRPERSRRPHARRPLLAPPDPSPLAAPAAAAPAIAPAAPAVATPAATPAACPGLRRRPPGRPVPGEPGNAHRRGVHGVAARRAAGLRQARLSPLLRPDHPVSHGREQVAERLAVDEHRDRDQRDHQDLQRPRQRGVAGAHDQRIGVQQQAEHQGDRCRLEQDADQHLGPAQGDDPPEPRVGADDEEERACHQQQQEARVSGRSG